MYYHAVNPVQTGFAIYEGYETRKPPLRGYFYGHSSNRCPAL